MKRIVTILAILISWTYVTVQGQNIKGLNIDVTSAKLYMDMAGKAMNSNVMPDDEKWDLLFASPAYQALFSSVKWNRKTFKKNVRDAFEIVYDPVNTAVCDSIMAILDAVDVATVESELPFFVSTAYNVKENLGKYNAILDSLDMEKVVADANALALTLVPENMRSLTPEGSNIHFIVWDLECRALGDNLFLDVNTFFHDGLPTATEMLAHEMHHFYLPAIFDSIYADDIMDGAVLALINNMREGVADILNKKTMPLESLYPYGARQLAAYNADYEDSPQVLARLDAATCDYLDGKIDMEQYFKEGMAAAHYEGHTTGDFMVFLIRDRLGMEAVLESVGDLDAFVDNYNKAAEKAGTYRFSDRFTSHIHNLSLPAKRIPKKID